jgi:predicted oxidoreductase
MTDVPVTTWPIRPTLPNSTKKHVRMPSTMSSSRKKPFPMLSTTSGVAGVGGGGENGVAALRGRVQGIAKWATKHTHCQF